jgi:hypothetical protein
LLGDLRRDQMVVAVEDFLASAAADQAAAQFELILGDAECRLAEGTLGRQRHQRTSSGSMQAGINPALP